MQKSAEMRMQCSENDGCVAQEIALKNPFRSHHCFAYSQLQCIAQWQKPYQACSGICLGILLVRTGSSMAGFLYPKYDPTKTNGTDMPNHKKHRANKVVHGTAPEDFCPQTSIFSVMNMPKQMPGNSSETWSVAFFHCSPCRKRKKTWDRVIPSFPWILTVSKIV